ncbi:MAG: U32 family peptidase [Erysipelotrichaceae bacterium]|nr:U32 family peptidase [Erysipelotrichaceae bacterium]
MNIIVSLNNIDSLSETARFPISHVLIGDGHFSSGNSFMDREQIRKFISKAHGLELKVIIRTDRLYGEDELEDLSAYLRFLNDEGADGLLIGDLGVRMMVENQKLDLECLYAPETLLTNSHDVRQLLLDGMDGCVISKDIPLKDGYQIAKDNEYGCWLRVYGPVLIACSRRRFVSLYLQQQQERLENWYLQEESRQLMMPIVEKPEGSWLYGYCLHSLDSIREIAALPLKGIIFDDPIGVDDDTLQALRLHLEVLDGKKSAEEAYEQLPVRDGHTSYGSISAVRRTVLDKEKQE